MDHHTLPTRYFTHQRPKLAFLIEDCVRCFLGAPGRDIFRDMFSVPIMHPNPAGVHALTRECTGIQCMGPRGTSEVHCSEVQPLTAKEVCLL